MTRQIMQKITLIALFALLFGCSQKAVKPTDGEPTNSPTPTEQSSTQPPSPPIQIPTEPAQPLPAEKVDHAPASYPLLKPVSWSSIPAIQQDQLTEAWPAWLRGCSTLVNQAKWQSVCQQAMALKSPTQTSIQNYFVNHFNVFSASNENGTDSGTITGYYQPLLHGSMRQSKQYPYPLYQAPHDLISVNLADLYPELKHKRIRGRLVDKKLVPYYSRAEIDVDPSPLKGSEIVWINDIIDVFFLQIQGSGLVKLDNGDNLHVGYANQNGHAYKSIGKALVKRGELKLSQASMQGIKNWARNNPSKLRNLLNENPSYVFFRALPKNLPGPLGALGIPITAERSVAVDRKYIPLGAPLFLSTTYPNTNKPMNRLMMAQDTGGAIKNGVRADFYWGAGDAAGNMAGKMKQSGKIWVLLPKDF